MLPPPNLLCRFYQELFVRDQLGQNIDIEAVIFKARPAKFLFYQLVSSFFHNSILLFRVISAKPNAVLNVVVHDEIQLLLREPVVRSQHRIDFVKDGL